MTKAEDKKHGMLNVDIDYLSMAQTLNNVIYMCQKLKDKLDIAAINKKTEVRDDK